MSILSSKTTATTTPSTNKHFSVEEICAIIKECARSGVKELDVLELSITFMNNHAPVVEPIRISNEYQRASDSQERESNIRAEVQSREEDLSLLLIEDPVRYEELLRMGELKDERT
jgi:hypothetical protein